MSTQFKPAQCPSCKGMLQVPIDRETVTCMYCSTTININVAILAVQGPSVDNLLTLARTASASNNSQEAYNYYTKVLELDSRNIEAWCGKAASAGWMSTLKDFRLPEMVSGFTQAIAFATDTDKPAIRNQAGNTINDITIAFYSIARKHVQEFIQVDNVWVDYLNQCSAMLVALDQANGFMPTNKTIIENIIYICKDNMEGISYTDYQGNSRLASLSPEYEAQLKQTMDKSTWKLRKLDPSYQPPEIKKATASGCATMIAFCLLVMIMLLMCLWR